MTVHQEPPTTAAAAPEPRMIWVRLAVDPLAVPLSRRLLKWRWVTADRVTLLAFGLALGAAGCFAAGALRWGGALFLARFFFDCVDGMIARGRGSSSARGAALDISADVVGTHLVAAALAMHLVAEGHAPLAAGMLLLAVLGIHNWSLAHRKALASQAGLGGGGFDHGWRRRPPGLRRWINFSQRHGMVAFPWVLEVEILVFGLGPLLLPPSALHWTVWFGCAGFAAVAAVSLLRIRHITGRLDAARTEHRRTSV